MMENTIETLEDALHLLHEESTRLYDEGHEERALRLAAAMQRIKQLTQA